MKPTATSIGRPGCNIRAGALLCVLLGGFGLIDTAAAADEVAPPRPPERDSVTAIGWEAVALMQQDRREQRGVPRMVPLLTTPAASQGRLWLGLSRPRQPVEGGASVQLEMVWVIPIGR